MATRKRKQPQQKTKAKPKTKQAPKKRKERLWVKADPVTGPRLYQVRSSTIHNRGVFAARDIEAGARIIQYLGEKITKAEAERRADAAMERAELTGGGAVYIFNLNQRHDIDGAFAWNTARLINHSCAPNCEVQIIRGRIWIVALCDIPQGEELTFNYGFDLESYEEHPCFCGSHRCIGFIAGEDYWPELRRKLRSVAASINGGGSRSGYGKGSASKGAGGKSGRRKRA